MRKFVGVLVGTRPTLIKLSPVIRELARRKIPYFVLHAGQHYSHEMDRLIFRDLGLRYPEYVVKSAQAAPSPGAQTARMIEGIERVLLREKPSVLLVGGDTNANLAGALAARKLNIYLGHVESGCRSHDWEMPEEHNRILIDHISDALFAPSKESCRNLFQENVHGKILNTGSTASDALDEHSSLAEKKRGLLKRFSISSRGYILVTLHRASNVDDKRTLSGNLSAVEKLTKQLRLKAVFPVHPRTWKRIQTFGLRFRSADVLWTKPLGYLEMIFLIKHAALVLTDSGGVQQEACMLKTPCVTLRDNTEWGETLKAGANCLAGSEPEKISRAASRMIKKPRTWRDPFVRGASKKIVNFLEREGLYG